MLKFNVTLLSAGFMVLSFFSCSLYAQSSVAFPGLYSYLDGNAPPVTAFKFTPDGSKGVSLTISNTVPNGAQISSFDPATLSVIDTEMVGTSPQTFELVQLSDGIRVVVLSRNGGFRTVTIYDLDNAGQLTFRAATQMADAIPDSTSNMVLGSRVRAGFVRLTNNQSPNQIISFSLDSGAVLQRLDLLSSQKLHLFEDGKRCLLVSGNVGQLNIIDVNDPTNMHSLGTVTLPTTNAGLGYNHMHAVFSKDGNFVFAGGPWAKLSAVNTHTLQIANSLPNTNYLFSSIKVFESGQTRLIGMRVAEGNSAFKGYVVINAADPANLSVINELSIGAPEVFNQRDFAFSADGKKIAITNDTGLNIYRLPTFQKIFSNTISAGGAYQIESYGARERFAGAWETFPNGIAKILFYPNRENTLANFNHDGISDLVMFRPSTGTWYIKPDNFTDPTAIQFGLSGDIPLTADFDGDKVSDLGVFRPATGNWIYLQSSDGAIQTRQLGISSDQFIPADYDGDGKDDPAVFRPAANQWIILRSSDGQLMSKKWGSGRGRAMRGDYDGDGTADYAFYRNTGLWQISNSGGSVTSTQLGQAGDIPVSGDYDNDGRSDIGVFRANPGVWIISQSFAGPFTLNLGGPGDIPVPADYDGDGKTDEAIFRPSNNLWILYRSNSQGELAVGFGQAGDIPVIAQK